MRKVAAVVMAAGRASRFGAGPEGSKVLAELDGTPLVRRVAEIALASRAVATFVVTGQAAEFVGLALEGLPVTLVRNPDYASGMAGSVKVGIAALPADIDGVLILLADMPRVAVSTLDTLVATFDAAETMPDAIVPVHEEHEGNPVLLGRTLFAEVARLVGDVGARKILSAAGCRIVRCQVDDPGIAIDVDTRDALRALGG